MHYYPVYLDLKDRNVLVVGGGEIAQGKILQLVEAGARVSVVSPTLTPRLAEMAEQRVIDYHAGNFATHDLLGASLVISATGNQEVNEKVARLASERKMLCNVVDQPALSNFITPALITRGDLQISVSSSGGSPTLTQRVNRALAGFTGEEYGDLAALQANIRSGVNKRAADFEQRRGVLRAVIESDALALLREGKREEARRIATELRAREEQIGVGA